MPRVTEVLGYSTPPELVAWFKRTSQAKAEAIAKHTADIGQRVDSLIQQDIREGGFVPPNDCEEAFNCMYGWEQIKREHPDFVGSVTEMQVELEYDGIKGHPDFVHGPKDGGPWGVTDLKCTSGIRTKNWIQVGKYAQMLMATRGWSTPSFLRIIRLQRDSPKPEWLEITNDVVIRYCMEAFDYYLGVFNTEPFLKEHFRLIAEEGILNGGDIA